MAVYVFAYVPPGHAVFLAPRLGRIRRRKSLFQGQEMTTDQILEKIASMLQE